MRSQRANKKIRWPSHSTKVGIEDFRPPHDLRHTCSAWLVQSGVPLAAIRDLLRHTTAQMTEKYAHLAPETIRAAVAVLDGTRSHFGHAEQKEEKMHDVTA